MKRIAAIATLSMAAVAVLGAPVSAQEDAVMSPEQELVERYAPILMLKEQAESCDPDGEPYAPQSVDIVLDNPDVVLRQVGNGNPILKVAPTAADLYRRSEGFFLDFPGGALEPGCIYEQDFDRYTGTVTGEREPVVYAHIATQADEPGKLAVQYWFYWYYNDWNNKHESDWEGIQLLFDVGTVAEALQTEPVSAGYAQHEGGERADWDSSKLQRDGSRPFVYPSRGSHASYYGSALYLGRSAAEGFGCDTTDAPSVRTEPSVILLQTASSGPEDEFAWLDYNGRWGERQSGAFNGPTGPQGKQRWTNPVDWHDELRAGSVVVPTGDSQADAIVATFCTVVEHGSGALVTLKTSPLRLLITLAAIGGLGLWLARRTVWDRVDALPMVRRRRSGQIIRAAAGSYRRRAGVLITIGLVYLPVAVLVAATTSVLQVIPLVRRITDVAGNAAETNVLFALLAGSVANLLAFVAVNAMVAAYYDLLGDGDIDASGTDAVRRAWSHAPDLAVGFARSLAVVLVLLISVVGIPFGIWFLVRYQFMAQVVVTEDRNGKDALARSAELVKGRWWHTAANVAVFNFILVATGVLVGLLVLASGISLWLFSGVISLALALIVPLAAVAQTLLFGDAVAEFRGSSALDADVDADVDADTPSFA